MLLDQLADAVDLFPAEAAAAIHPDWVEPELRLAVVAFDVDVRRLAPIASVEEEPESTRSQHSRHTPMLHPPSAKSNSARPKGTSSLITSLPALRVGHNVPMLRKSVMPLVKPPLFRPERQKPTTRGGTPFAATGPVVAGPPVALLPLPVRRRSRAAGLGRDSALRLSGGGDRPGAPFIEPGRSGVSVASFDPQSCLEAVARCRQFDRRLVSAWAAGQFDARRIAGVIVAALESL